MADVRAAAMVNHMLWEGSGSRGRSFLPRPPGRAGGRARGRVAGRSDRLSFACTGGAARVLSRETRPTNQAIAAVREPPLRLAAAAAPFAPSHACRLRHLASMGGSLDPLVAVGTGWSRALSGCAD